KFSSLRSITTTSSVCGGYWNKDWKPGPYPRTPEERKKAAQKYGLLPQDYEPFEDDGMAPGDYPKLELVPFHQRDPYYNWDDPWRRRDWNEPVHQMDLFWTSDKGYGDTYPWSTMTMFKTFLCYALGIPLLWYLTPNLYIMEPVMPRHMFQDYVINPDLKRYSFELTDEKFKEE
ncbi:hypothetical protein SNEBB_007647, partial [Seison nebaliae]